MPETTDEQERAFGIVTEVINAWDPHGLIAMGCPPDEFDAEVADVLRELPALHSAEDAARVLSEVFGRWFSPETFPVAACVESGRRLYLALRQEGLVP